MPAPRPPGWRSLFHSLGVVLFLWFFTVVLAAFAVYAFVSVRTTSRQWRETVESGALAWSELIQQATHQGMLRNHKEDVHEIIRTVAATPGVVGVRIYDKQGIIIHSAQAGEIGRRVDLKAESCVVCHQGQSTLDAVPQGERARIFREPGGRRVLGLINAIENSPACSGAGCHAHPPEETVLGVLDVKMSLSDADRRLAAARRLSYLAAAALALAVGGTSALFIDRFVRRPIGALIAGTRRVAGGDLATTFEVRSRNEIGQLAEAFNSMTRELARAQRENEEWARTLERKVVEETAELSRTQRQVVHMEKMASLGTLAATVAHELNNPLAGILNYAKLVERSLTEGAEGADGAEKPEERDEVRRFLQVIQQEAGRCGKIVRNFLLFARRSGGEFVLHSLNAILEQALAILRHHLEMRSVELSWTPLAGDDQLVCDPGQVQQAVLNLFVNAVEAMPEGGTLTVAVQAADDELEVTVADTGVGIAPEALPRIFEPFYTTKEASGSGLGLSVVYGIVERHGGTIDVESDAARGTTFRLTLPRHPPLPVSEPGNRPGSRPDSRPVPAEETRP
jgi:two-component system NtrC family sensor kinase